MRFFAIECPMWPFATKEWLSRKRDNEWPSETCIGRIAEGGCHLVAKPHELNLGDDTEWRYSFSKAEIILINTWNAKQKHIYHILRLIKRGLIQKLTSDSQTVFSTYFIKTLMFWKCEQWPENAWTQQELVSIVNELLLTYVEWLNNKQCANYFIPEYNMWDHVKDGRCFDEAISLIVETVESGSVQVCLQNCPVPEESEKFEFDQLNEETRYFMYQACWYVTSCFGYLPLSNTFSLTTELWKRFRRIRETVRRSCMEHPLEKR